MKQDVPRDGLLGSQALQRLWKMTSGGLMVMIRESPPMIVIRHSQAQGCLSEGTLSGTRLSGGWFCCTAHVLGAALTTMSTDSLLVTCPRESSMTLPGPACQHSSSEDCLQLVFGTCAQVRRENHAWIRSVYGVSAVNAVETVRPS